MYELNYNLIESLETYQQMISDYSVFLFIMLAMIVFGLLLWLNRNTKTTFYFTLGTFLLLLVMTIYFRRTELIDNFSSMFSRYFYKNLYFYHWNTLLCFLLMHFSINAKKNDSYTKSIVILFFVILSTNAIFQFYISDFVGNGSLMVLGNTFPMIIVGNVISFILYFYLIILKIIAFFKRK